MENNTSRRHFLKKMAYTAPAIVALGALTSPSDALAIGSSKLTFVRSKLNANGLRVSVWKDTTTGDKYKYTYNADGSLKKETHVFSGADDSDD